MTDRTESRHTPIGEAGQNVIANVERLRAARHLSLRQLSDRLGALGRPMMPSAVHAVTKGRRRVDADDLVALAAVLGVTPAGLLAPPGDPPPDHAAGAAARQLAGCIGDLLAARGDPEAARDASEALDRALRRVQLEAEELLADVRRETLQRERKSA